MGTRPSNVTGPGDLGLCEVSSEQEDKSMRWTKTAVIFLFDSHH
jgi:hypothetical protein